jgi:hypothetical protein
MLYENEQNGAHQMLGRTVALLLDADGSFYNYRYFKLLSHLMQTYGIQVIAAGQGRLSVEERDALINQIKQDIWAVDLASIQICNFEDIEVFLPFSQEFKTAHYTADRCPSVTYEQQVNGFLRYKFIEILDSLDRSMMDDVFLRANRYFTNRLKERIKTENISNLIFAIGSLRQCFRADHFSSILNGTRLFAQDFILLAKVFDEVINRDGVVVNILIEKFTLSDVDSDKASGDSLLMSLNFDQYDQGSLPTAVYETSKVRLVMAFSHQLFLHYGSLSEGKFQIELYDDCMDVMKYIDDSFSYHCDGTKLLPPIELRLYKYVGEDKDLQFRLSDIQGQGRVEPDFRQFVIKMAAMCRKDDPNKTSINVARDLNFDEFIQDYLSIKYTIYKFYNNALTLFSSIPDKVQKDVQSTFKKLCAK